MATPRNLVRETIKIFFEQAAASIDQTSGDIKSEIEKAWQTWCSENKELISNVSHRKSVPNKKVQQPDEMGNKQHAAPLQQVLDDWACQFIQEGFTTMENRKEMLKPDSK